MELKKGIYWVGADLQYEGLQCNPYLIIDGDEAALIDPGSVLDFEYVFKNVTDLIPLEKLKYVILHHEDPDLCSSVPLFEAKGADFTIITHWRTHLLSNYYGIKSEYWFADQNDYTFRFKSGRELRFIPTPYLHFAGAIATYDSLTKILFSSDLFGAILTPWSLFADENYIESMKAFHEHYMPSNEILSSVMRIFLTMDIEMIAPQHGCVINDNIENHIEALRDLDCGTYMQSVSGDLGETGKISHLLSLVLRRYASIFGASQALEAIEGIDMKTDANSFEVTDYNYSSSELWNLFFQIILDRKGIHWLIIIEPFIERLCRDYSIEKPTVFQSNLKSSQEQMTLCPVTRLYNKEFYNSYLSDVSPDKGVSSLIIISLDNTDSMILKYGYDELNVIMKNVAYIIKNVLDENGVAFRLEGSYFAVYLEDSDEKKAVEIAEKLRNSVSQSNVFIDRTTISLGVASTESYDENQHKLDLKSFLNNKAFKRVQTARISGINRVYSSSDMEEDIRTKFRIAMADTDRIHMEVLKRYFENEDFEVHVAHDGEDLLEIINDKKPDIVISEVMLQKSDIFLVREKVLKNSTTKNIPFILTSHLKTEDTVSRAISLGICCYLKKPYILKELFGIVYLTLKGDQI